jgi:hypothetical protein
MAATELGVKVLATVPKHPISDRKSLIINWQTGSFILDSKNIEYIINAVGRQWVRQIQGLFENVI